MLTLLDCLDMCDLSSEVVDAIAEHEKLPCIVAAELGNCLACSPTGLSVIHRYILDDIADADGHGDHRRRARMEAALGRFREAHPGLPALG
jgi:hypothetical protein